MWFPFQDPKKKCMMLKFDYEEIEGSGNQEDNPDDQPEIILTNKWYKENCKGVSNPTAFLAERSKKPNSKIGHIPI